MPELLRPPRLKPGHTIGIAAVSGPVDPERLERGIAYLRAKGYEVLEASNLRKRHGFLAGTDQERAAGYRTLLCDPTVAAIFFARGGYGAARVLDHLETEELRSHPKIHLGGSDLTAFFRFLQRGASLVTFYGPMVAVEMGSAEELDWESVLSGETPAPHTFAPEDVLAPGRARGVLLGGCLSLLASLAGTPEALSARGAILFWEDTGEEIYRIDRLLTQLERSGTFDGVQGLVIGSVVPHAQKGSGEQIREYLRDRFRGSPFPVAMGLPAGHLPRPRTLPLGASLLLDLESTLELAFLAPAVA
jgi:muramoyltetrapeptide carboxypeptidase